MIGSHRLVAVVTGLLGDAVEMVWLLLLTSASDGSEKAGELTDDTLTNGRGEHNIGITPSAVSPASKSSSSVPASPPSSLFKPLVTSNPKSGCSVTAS